MGLFDSMLSQIGDGLDARALGEKLGIPADKIEQAVAALGIAHPQPGDTIKTAADSSGLPHAQLGQIVDALGGEGALDRLSGLLGKGRNPVTDKLSDLFGD